MPGGRNSYSEEDDALLVEYLAESGTSEGRKGKNVYQRLVENTEGRWPWSSRHPWQSWRSHYIKDEELFDRKIRVYQRQKLKATKEVSTSDNSKKEETNASEPLRKRKTSPVVESKREQKRRKVQDVPVKKVDGSPSKGPAPSRKQNAPLAYNGFVPVSQLFRRNQPVSDDKGEGSSRDGARAQSNSTKAAPSTARTTYPTRLPEAGKPPLAPLALSAKEGNYEKESIPYRPPPDDYLEEHFSGGSDAAHEMELDPEADQDDDEDEVGQMLMDVSQEKSSTNLYPSIESVPLPSKRPTTTPNARKSTLKGNSGAPAVFFESPSVPSDTDQPLQLPKPKPAPKLIEGPFGARHKQPVRWPPSSGNDSDSESKEPPKKVWPPVRGQKKKSPGLLREDGDSATSPRDLSAVQQNRSLEATESNAPKRVSRKGKERETVADEGGNQSEVNLVANQRPGTEKKVNGKDEVMQTEKEHKPLSSSLPQPKPKLESTSSRRIVVDDDDDDNEETDMVTPHNDQHESTHFSQSHPTSPPMSDRETTTEAASSDNEAPYDGPLFTQPGLPYSPQSQSRHPFDIPQSPYQTPPPLHPFDAPPSRPQSLAPYRSGGIPSQLVSQDTATMVIDALKTFLSEVRTIERDRQAERESRYSDNERRGESEGVLPEKAERSILRARGSPVRTGPKKRQTNGLDPHRSSLPSSSPVMHSSPKRGRIVTGPGPNAQAHRSPLTKGTPVGHSGPGQRGSSVKFQVKREGPDVLQSHSSSVARVDRPRTLQSPATIYPSAEPLQHADDDADEGSTGDSSMHSLFSAPSSPSRDPGISTPNKEKSKANDELDIPSSSHRDPSPSTLNKGKNRIVVDEVDHRNPSRASSSHSKHIDLRQLVRRKDRARRSLPRRTQLSTSSSAVSRKAVPPAQFTSRSSSNSSENSPLKLSPSDQSRLIERTIQDMAEKYEFPPEHVRYIWKKAGDLNEAAVVLAQLKETQDALLRETSVRRSSSVPGTGIRSTQMRSSPLTGDRSSPARDRHSGTAEVRGTLNAGPLLISIPTRSPRRRTRNSSRDHDTFSPIILDGPGPDPGYSPPTHSRAGQVTLLSSQGRVKEALQRERRHASRDTGRLIVRVKGFGLSTS